MSLIVENSFRPRSLSGVRDVIESYRRAQEYLSDSISASASDALNDEDLQKLVAPPIDEEAEIASLASQTSQTHDAFLSNLQWDEDLASVSAPQTTVPSYASHSSLLPRRQFRHDPATPTAAPPSITTPQVEDRTPLLSQSYPAMSYMGSSSSIPAAFETAAAVESTIATVARQASQRSLRKDPSIREHHLATTAKIAPGYSTFGQTRFNAIAILLGIGMLSEPLSFALAGWIGGTIILIFYGYVTCYTAKILAHIILDDPRLKSYSDIGRKAFGPRSGPWISAVFCLELFTVSVALVTLYADSLYAVIPTYSPNTYKLIGIAILIPTTLLPLSILSYTSVIGIVSTLIIIAVILIDGFAKPDSPGSLWSPADTSLGVRSVEGLGLSFGIFMAGFSGHAVIPSLVRDMIDPTQFDAMITQAFIVATTIYVVIGVAGYTMFGNSVSDEFSRDLAKYSVFPVLNKIALWGLVLSPLSKFALSARPLNFTLEMILGIETGTGSIDDHGAKSTTPDAEPPTTAHRGRHAFKHFLVAVERTFLTLCSVAVSIFVPEFASMMAFLGAFSSFLLCVIGPISAKIALAKHCGLRDGIFLASGIIMATWGTIAAFWSMGA